MLFYFIFSFMYPHKIGAVIQDDPELLKSSEGYLECKRCKVRSTEGIGYKFEQRLFGKKPAIYCPECSSKRRTTSLARILFFYALIGIIGLVLVSVSPDSSLGWLLLNLFLLELFVILMIVPHELGHALTGFLLKARVFKVSIGFGRTLISKRLFGWEWEMKAIPLSGATFVYNTSRRLFRLRRFLITLAGPLSNALIVIFLVILVDTAYLSVDFPLHKMHPVYALYLANLLMLVISLLPIKSSTAYGVFPGDGLALIQIPFYSSKKVDEMLGQYYAFECEEFRKQKKYEAAKQICSEGLKNLPNNTQILNNLAILLLDLKEYDNARDIFRTLLDRDDIRKEVKILLKNNMAFTNLLIGRPDRLPEADAYSAEAYGDAPWNPAFKGTRGSVLVETGKLEEGITLLKESMSLTDEVQGKALNAAYIAVGEMKKGNAQESKRYYDLAKKFDPDCPLLVKIELNNL